MAIFKLGAMFDAISGKVGGQSLCNYPQQQILRNITQTNKFATPKQSKKRAFTAYLTNSWRQLTTAQRQGWDATAINYTYINRVGDTITRNGYQTFCFCNQNLNLIEIPTIDDAPLYVPVTEPKINIIDISSGNFEIQSNNSSSDYLYALFGVANLSNGQSAQLGMMRYIGEVTSAQLLAGYDVVSDMEDVFGTLTFPNKMAITVDPINQTTGNRKQFVEIIENIDLPMIIEVVVADGNSLTIPFATGGTYAGSIDWGDGVTTTFVAFNSVGCTHTYTLGGTYQILIFGAFPKFIVSNGTFKTYLTDVLQFGSNTFTQLNFYGCTLLTTVNTIDTPTLGAGSLLSSAFRTMSGLISWNNIENWDCSNVTSVVLAFDNCLGTINVANWNISLITSLNGTFRNAAGVTGFASWDVSLVTDMTEAFKQHSNIDDCSAWNITNALTIMTQTFVSTNINWSIATWDTSNVTSMNQLFRYVNYNVSLASNNYSSVTNMVLFFQGNTAFSTVNYDALLVKIVADVPQMGVTMNMTNAKYTIAGAGGTARAALIATYGWTITDGGGI